MIDSAVVAIFGIFYLIFIMINFERYLLGIFLAPLAYVLVILASIAYMFKNESDERLKDGLNLPASQGSIAVDMDD